MKPGWEIKDLKSVSTVNYGYTESASSAPVGPRFLRITDIQDDRVNWESVPYCKIEPTNLPKYRLASGDIVFARTGATTPHLYQRDITEFPVVLPPLPEQQRIVGILDEAFESIATAKANAEKNLQNARALFESYLQAVFTERGEGWVEKRLGDVFDIGSSKRILEKEWTATGVPFYGGKEIVKLAKSGTVVSNAYISEEKYRDYASKYDMPRQGDILITARGTIGVGYVVKKGDKFYYKDGNIISMRAKTPTNPDFILYAFRSNVMADQLGDLTGTTVRHLPIEKAKELVLMMPDFASQNTVVEQAREVEGETHRLASVYERKLAALEELKKSLLHQAFSGQLSNRAMNDIEATTLTATG